MGMGYCIHGMCVVGFALLLSAASAQEQPPRLNLMPLPANLQTGSGSLRIDSSFSVALTGHTEGRLDRAVQRFLRQLSRQTALPLSAKPSAKPTLTAHTDHASKEVQELGEDESYTLSITAEGAKIEAPTPLGAMHGLQTFLQLVEVSPDGFAAPAVTIQDKPRFPWRGLMIDVARHFIPLDILKRKWGIFDPAMDLTNEKTYKFLDELVGEMGKLFPDHYFHVGGDEVNGKQWDANPKIQEFKKSHNLASNEALQAYFSERVQRIVTKHGKAVVGWDEVFIPGVPKDIVIQSWRGQASLAQAAAQGYHGILSNGYYLDLGWSAARHYAVDPASGPAANLTPEQQQLILGGESCMWSEYVNPENIDSRIWPRNAAIAERLWSPQNVTDVASMYARLHAISAQLEWLGLTPRSY